MSPARAPLARMKILALGLLLLVALLYCLATWMGAAHPAWGYLAAFAEAAMVGAIADWFAVTALFRHPLGLPIPHTAIIPRKKARLGGNLSDFICTHFLATPQIMAKLQHFDAAERLAAWLCQPHNARALAERGGAVVDFLLRALREEAVQQFIRHTLLARLARLDLACLAGDALAALVRDGRHQAALDELLRWADRLLRDEATQRRLATALSAEFGGLRVRLFGKELGLDDKAGRWSAERVVARLSVLLGEVAGDPRHELRGQFAACLDELVQRLRSDPRYRLKGETLRAELLAHPALAGYLDDLWQALLDDLGNDLARGADSRLRGRLAGLLQRLGSELAADAELRGWIDRRLREGVPPLLERYREAIGRYIAARVEAWDDRELVELLERQVGRDLQFIRINGTLVGGCVGLLLHALTALAATL